MPKEKNVIAKCSHCNQKTRITADQALTGSRFYCRHCGMYFDNPIAPKFEPRKEVTK